MPRYTPRFRPPHSVNLPVGLKFELVEAPREGTWRADLPRSSHQFGVIETKDPIAPEALAHFDLIEVAGAAR